MKTLSEIDTTSKRATRGAGFSWGIAEEVGKNMRLLELFGLSGVKNLNKFLKDYKEKQFKKINEAYYILRDKEKRAQYDQFGHQAFEGNGGAGFKDFDFGSSGFSDIFEEMFGDFDDGFGGIFGGGRRTRKTTRRRSYRG